MYAYVFRRKWLSPPSRKFHYCFAIKVIISPPPHCDSVSHRSIGWLCVLGIQMSPGYMPFSIAASCHVSEFVCHCPGDRSKSVAHLDDKLSITYRRVAVNQLSSQQASTDLKCCPNGVCHPIWPRIGAVSDPESRYLSLHKPWRPETSTYRLSHADNDIDTVTSEQKEKKNISPITILCLTIYINIPSSSD